MINSKKGYFYRGLGGEGEKREEEEEEEEEEERGGGLVDGTKEKKDNKVISLEGLSNYTIYHSLEHGKEEFRVGSYIGDGALGRTFHNTKGPAIIWGGKGGREWYYLGGVVYPNKKSWRKAIEDVRNMSEVMRLTDPRQWVREFKEDNV